MTKHKKKIIFNVANVIKGGAIQAAINFIVINQKIKPNQFDWYYVLSVEVFSELEKVGVTLENNCLVTKSSPAQSRHVKQEILAFEKSISPQLVFTLFGPCYVSFKSFHLSGFANGWVTHSTASSFIQTYNYNAFRITKVLLKYLYYAYHIRKADAWIFETDTARNGFIKRLRVAKKLCTVVANTSINFGSPFAKTNNTIINNKILYFKDNLIVALAADYPHKNLFSLLKSAKLLKNNLLKEKFKIIFTLDNDIFSQNFLPYIIENQLQEYIVNIGKVDIADLSKLYSVAYASILPSFIETFSAVYPESFATSTPVITTDAPFAREICKGAAIYCDPASDIDIADAINTLLYDKNKYNKLVIEGDKLYQKMLTPTEKYLKYIEVIQSFINTDKAPVVR